MGIIIINGAKGASTGSRGNLLSNRCAAQIVIRGFYFKSFGQVLVIIALFSVLTIVEAWSGWIAAKDSWPMAAA